MEVKVKVAFVCFGHTARFSHDIYTSQRKGYFDPVTSYSIFNFNNEYHVEEEVMRVSNPGTPVDWLTISKNYYLLIVICDISW